MRPASETTTPNPATDAGEIDASCARAQRRRRVRGLVADEAADEFLQHRGVGEIAGPPVEDLLRNKQGAFKFKVKGASGEDEFAHRAEPVDDLEIALAEAELEGKKS